MSEVRNGLGARPDVSADDVTVARLIRMAGHRPPVPDTAAEIVKTAARAQWQWTVAGERRRARFYRGAGALLAAAAVVLIFVGSGLWHRLQRGFGEPVAVLARGADGEGGQFKPGDWLTTGAKPVTVGMLAAGESVRVDADSRVRFASRSVLDLEQGAVYVDSARPGSNLEVRTDLGTVRHIGTQFEVRLLSAGGEPTMRVRVREGEVEVEDRGGRLRTLVKGEGLAVAASGVVAEAVACHGPQWDWVTAGRPPFETKGRSVLEVLLWGTREGCWELEFAVAVDRDKTAGVTLESSTFPDGPLADALDSVLWSSDLGLRLNRESMTAGVLRIERRPSPE